MTATTPLGRLRLALRDAQTASARLSSRLKSNPTDTWLRDIAADIGESLALAVASLNAAQPALDSHTITIDGDISIMGKIAPSAIWLDLGEGEAK